MTRDIRYSDSVRDRRHTEVYGIMGSIEEEKQRIRELEQELEQQRAK